MLRHAKSGILAFLLTATCVAGSAEAQEVAPFTAPRTIAFAKFCAGLQVVMKDHVDHVTQDLAMPRSLIASFWTQEFVTKLARGELTDITSLPLGPLRGTGVTVYGGVNEGVAPSMVQAAPYQLLTAHLFAQGFGIPPQALLFAKSADELRYLPHIAPRAHIVVLARDADTLSLDKVRAVAAVALRQRLTIHLVRLATPTGAPQLDSLKALAGITGGVMIEVPAQPMCGAET